MRLLAYIIFAITWLAACGAIIEAFALRGTTRTLLAIAILLPLILVVITIHELGHALAVKKLGGRVESLMIAGIEFVRSERPAEPQETIAREIGGHVVYSFDGGETRREHAIIAAAGPVANIVLGLAFALLAITWNSVGAQPTSAAPTLVTTTTGPPSGTPTSGPRLRTDEEVRAWVEANPQALRRGSNGKGIGYLLGAFAILSLGIALANLIPFKGSDGAALKDAMTPAWRR